MSLYLCIRHTSSSCPRVTSSCSMSRAGSQQRNQCFKFTQERKVPATPRLLCRACSSDQVRVGESPIKLAPNVGSMNVSRSARSAQQTSSQDKKPPATPVDLSAWLDKLVRLPSHFFSFPPKSFCILPCNPLFFPCPSRAMFEQPRVPQVWPPAHVDERAPLSL